MEEAEEAVTATDPPVTEQSPQQQLDHGIEQLFDCSFKLGVRRETSAVAALYFHEFFEDHSPAVYDSSLLAATALFLAAKVREDRVQLRDVINVFYSTLNPGSEPLDRGSVFSSLCQSVVDQEQLLARALSFRLTRDPAHRYLLQYLQSLTDWLAVSRVEKVTFARTSWALVNDFYRNAKCLDHSAAQIAVSVISLSLKIHDLTVPCDEEAVLTWHEALLDDLSKEKMSEIESDLVSTYKQMT